MKNILIFLVLLVCGTGTAGAEIVNTVAAVINDEVITTYQLDRMLSVRRDMTQREFSPEQRMSLRREILPELIEESLIEQRAKKLDIRVGEAELEAAVQDVLKQNNLSRERLKEALAAQGVSMEDYLDTLRKQIQRFKLLARDFKVEISTNDIRDYFREHIDDYRGEASVTLNRLSFALPQIPRPEQIEAVRKKAEEALTRLRKGEDFNVVLLTYAADADVDGGEMGTFAHEELSSSFEEAVRELGEGETSRIIETPTALHILVVAERDLGKIRQYDDVKGEIARILREERSETYFRKWIEDLKKEAYVDIRI